MVIAENVVGVNDLKPNLLGFKERGTMGGVVYRPVGEGILVRGIAVRVAASPGVTLQVPAGSEVKVNMRPGCATHP